MNWIQVSVTTPAGHAGHVEDALLALGAVSVTLADAHDDPVLEPAPGEVRIWDETVVTGMFDGGQNIDELRGRVTASLAGAPFDISELADQDWARAWMDGFQPMQFGHRLWVVPRHLQAPDPDAVVLKLDPGLAFGTGTHPTTALCLDWLDGHPPHGRVLDYGCGSGILAIAALLLGADGADATDIDEQALLATRDNAAENGVAARVHTCLPGALHRTQYALVMANILSGPLTELAPALASYTRPGGDVILSGILEEQADGVEAAYREYYNMDLRETRDGWVLLHGRRLQA